MILRFAVIAAVLATFVVLGTPWNGPAVTLQPNRAVAAPAGAPAGAPVATTTNGLQFSTHVDSNGRPEDPRVEFGDGTNVVWASFEYRDHDPNAKVSALVRANGDDYDDFKLDCCGNRSGRFAFEITKRNGGGDLPGAAYDVRVYVNDVEVAQGGFGVNGRQGLDNDGESHGNDNN
jgi:hypothetical protein